MKLPKSHSLSQKLGAFLRAATCVPFLMAVARERYRQELRWGRQDHPSHNTAYGPDPLRARNTGQRCEDEFREGNGSWAAVLDEECAEALGEPEGPALRKELVQVAAVASAWDDCIARRVPSAWPADLP